MKPDGSPSVYLADCADPSCEARIWTHGGPRGRRYCDEHRYGRWRETTTKKPPPPGGDGGLGGVG